MTYKILNRDEHYNKDEPKRILSLDGGGLRGILSLSMLLRIESILKEKHGNDDGFRLAHYFDLMVGTSTGAIIAAALAQGMTVAEIIEKYNELGNKVFKRSIWRQGIIRALYDEDDLIAELKSVFGQDTTMSSDSIQTGLLIVTKRLDTGSTWPIANNPNGKYFNGKAGSDVIANGDYPLWQVVRASTAAPRFFEGETIDIASHVGMEPTRGTFVDGGVSPFNNPALQAFMYTTLDGYNVNWKAGDDKILLVSLGTGSRDPSVSPMCIEAGNALISLVSLMDDCASLVETIMQWMSSSTTARTIDRELGTLSNDLIAGESQFSYLRYNVELSENYLNTELNMGLPSDTIEGLGEMDSPENMPTLQSIGEVAGDKIIHSQDFPDMFDLT